MTFKYEAVFLHNKSRIFFVYSSCQLGHLTQWPQHKQCNILRRYRQWAPLTPSFVTVWSFSYSHLIVSLNHWRVCKGRWRYGQCGMIVLIFRIIWNNINFIITVIIVVCILNDIWKKMVCVATYLNILRNIIPVQKPIWLAHSVCYRLTSLESLYPTHTPTKRSCMGWELYWFHFVRASVRSSVYHPSVCQFHVMINLRIHVMINPHKATYVYDHMTTFSIKAFALLMKSSFIQFPVWST